MLIDLVTKMHYSAMLRGAVNWSGIRIPDRISTKNFNRLFLLV